MNSNKKRVVMRSKKPKDSELKNQKMNQMIRDHVNKRDDSSIIRNIMSINIPYERDIVQGDIPGNTFWKFYKLIQQIQIDHLGYARITDEVALYMDPERRRVEICGVKDTPRGIEFTTLGVIIFQGHNVLIGNVKGNGQEIDYESSWEFPLNSVIDIPDQIENADIVQDHIILLLENRGGA